MQHITSVLVQEIFNRTPPAPYVPRTEILRGSLTTFGVALIPSLMISRFSGPVNIH